MKNVFKKTVALVSAMSLMAVGAAVSVSASEEKFELEVQGGTGCTAVDAKDAVAGYNTYAVEAGSTIQANIVMVNSEGKKYDTICLRNSLGGLEYSKVLPKGKLAQAADDGSFVQYMESFGEPYVLDADETIVTYELKVPATAKPGDQFKVEWSAVGDYEFALIDTNVNEENMPYSMVPAVFVIPGAVETTVTTVTTPTPTTVTTTVTTPTPTTVTTAETTAATTTVTTAETTAVSTSATTTVSTTAGTTVSVSKAPSSPATGSSSNGVAALAVTMVAAAGAAIALKKKND